jgi:hypothetical protein
MRGGVAWRRQDRGGRAERGVGSGGGGGVGNLEAGAASPSSLSLFLSFLVTRPKP